VKIETVLAVPVFSGKSPTPSFIFSCYSFVRSGTVPFVLKFVQQALRLLWRGLDKVQPHASVGGRIWKELEPADLGEMAADVEMQQHFMEKKRPHHDISAIDDTQSNSDPSLAVEFESLETPSGVPSVRSIYTGSGSSPVFEPTAPTSAVPVPQQSTTTPAYQYQTFESIQGHIQDAVRSIGEMRPVHQHIATNEQGTKRAHVYLPPGTQQHQQQYGGRINQSQQSGQISSPLPMPRPLNPPYQVLANVKTSPQRPTASYQSQSMNITAQNQQSHMQIPNPIPNPISQTGPPSDYNYQSSPASSAYIGAPSVRETPPPITNTMASIPKNQISATGISFPIPPPNSAVVAPNGMSTSAVVPAAQISMDSPQYCLPTRQDAPNKKQSTSAKVSLGASDGTLFISFLLTNYNYLVSILALSN